MWVVLPTYDERDNLPSMLAAIRSSLPSAQILVVDDASPDGTGELADVAAQQDPSIRVLHRAGKEGLGTAYRAGFAHVIATSDAEYIVQMDCDFSHDPADLPRLLEALHTGAGLAIGSRYVPGGGTPGWSLKRRVISRAGSLFARVVLGLPFNDLTGGFKAWRRDVLNSVLEQVAHASGYGFQIETTWRAHRQGARIVELPIVFRDRVLGTSKMTGKIAKEAFRMVIAMRLTELPSLPHREPGKKRRRRAGP